MPKRIVSWLIAMAIGLVGATLTASATLAFDEAAFCVLVQQETEKANAGAGTMVGPDTRLDGSAVLCSERKFEAKIFRLVSPYSLNPAWRVQFQSEWNEYYCKQGIWRDAISRGWTVSRTTRFSDGTSHWMKAECAGEAAELKPPISGPVTGNPLAIEIPKCNGVRVPVTLATEPIRINPYGYCNLEFWYRHPVYVRQAGEEKRLGPFPPATPGKNVVFPPNVEWAWSAEAKFTAYVRLTNAEEPTGKPTVGSVDWRAACAAKYKSFNSDTGRFTGKDGKTRKCKP